MPAPDREPLPRINEGEAWPYSRRAYAGRLLWRLIWSTAWQICWKRFYFLRGGLLRLFGAKLQSPIQIARSAWIEMPWQLTMGRHTVVSERATLYNLGPLTIGEQTVISQDAYLCGGTHDYTDPTYPLIRAPIRIGNFVWIAAGAFIGPGVTIGDGAVIGARAVVTRDVEPWTVVAGNPARVIKKRVMKQSAASSAQSTPAEPPQ